MKQYTTTVYLRHSETQIPFTTPEAWAQGHSGQDIHSYATVNETAEVFIPEHAIGHIIFSTSEVESEAVTDAFCE